MKNSKYEIDMCNGSIMPKLISFSIPLMLSGILQLMFNAVDIARGSPVRPDSPIERRQSEMSICPSSWKRLAMSSGVVSEIQAAMPDSEPARYLILLAARRNEKNCRFRR